jgi:hypothetical protein
LGEFSPIGNFLTLGNCSLWAVFLITEVVNIFGLLFFWGYGFVNVDKTTSGCMFGNFFF